METTMQESTTSVADAVNTTDGAEKKRGGQRNSRPPEAAKRETRSEKKQAFMYLGPNVPGGILFEGSVYKNELPKHLDKVFEKVPEIKQLFIEVQEVPAFRAELARQGSEPYRLRQVAQKRIDEGVLNYGRV